MPLPVANCKFLFEPQNEGHTRSPLPAGRNPASGWAMNNKGKDTSRGDSTPHDKARGIPVALLHQQDDTPADLRNAVERMFTACGIAFAAGERVLVKPNLVSPTNAGLCCTHPGVVAAVCAHLLDAGAKPLVADSPAFGSAARVARACGLDVALAPLGLAVHTLTRPVSLALPFGGSIGLSLDALEAERIVSVGKLKGHGQFRVTAATKNLFGCVCGARKALAHVRLGNHPGYMERMVLAVRAALPPSLGVVDGIVAMHRGGPIHGQAFPLGLLGASPDTLALDTALYGLLGLTPGEVPLWAEARRQEMHAAQPELAQFVLEHPGSFNTTGFQLQSQLDPMRFKPLRFLRGRVKSLLQRLA